MSDLTERLSTARVGATSEDETVTAVVDGSGHVVEVTLDPKAMRLDSERLGTAVTQALRAAQSRAREALVGELRTETASAPDTEALHRLASDLGVSAQQRLGQISDTLDQLLSRNPTRQD